MPPPEYNPPYDFGELERHSAHFISRMKEETYGRMDHLYQFTVAELQMRGKTNLDLVIDAGTYYGPFVHYWLELGKKVLTFDADPKKVQAAHARPELQQAIQEHRLDILAMQAQNPAYDLKEKADLYAIFELVGAGFQGNAEEMWKMFQEMDRALKPGGYAFTLRSRSLDRALARIFPVHSFDEEKVILHRSDAQEMIDHLSGGKIEWFAQMITPLGGEPKFGVTITRDQDYHMHHRWEDNAYEVRPIDDLREETPMFWMGLWQKPLQRRLF